MGIPLPVLEEEVQEVYWIFHSVMALNSQFGANGALVNPLPVDFPAAVQFTHDPSFCSTLMPAMSDRLSRISLFLFPRAWSSQSFQPGRLDVLSYCAGGDGALYFSRDYFPSPHLWSEAPIIAAMLPEACSLSDAVEGIAPMLLLSHPRVIHGSLHHFLHNR